MDDTNFAKLVRNKRTFRLSAQRSFSEVHNLSPTTCCTAPLSLILSLSIALVVFGNRSTFKPEIKSRNLCAKFHLLSARISWRMSLGLKSSSTWNLFCVCSCRARSTCFNSHGVTNRMLFFAPSHSHRFSLFCQASERGSHHNNGKWNSRSTFGGVYFRSWSSDFVRGNSKTKKH